MKNLCRTFARLARGRQPVFRHGTLLAALCLPLSSGALPEPDTIFYGKIINRTSKQEYLVTSGSLSWVVSRPDGQQIALSAVLMPFNDGAFSYRLLVPHEALAYGLTISPQVVPLAVGAANCSHVQIRVDGNPASILAPGSATFSVSQALRGSSYRLDLEIPNPLPDGAGDGIPDWWQALYGAFDPNADPDQDGWSNLQEFLHGSNPTNDNRAPTLLTKELFAYAKGTTGLRLEALDADTLPENLTYTLVSAPQTGTVYLRNARQNPAQSDAALATGATFTQADVDRGRLIFVHESTDSSAALDSFTVSLADQSTNAASAGTVSLNVYWPAYADATLQLAQAAAACGSSGEVAGLPFYERQMLVNYFLSCERGYVVWDTARATAAQQLQVPSSGLTAEQYAGYVAAYGRDRGHVLMAGVGGDRLLGGMENDVVVAGRGADTLRGEAGADLFIIPGPGTGNDTIEDFTVSDHDVLDISRLLVGSSQWLTNYVLVTSSSSNSCLNINYDGTGGTFTNMVLTLTGLQLGQEDLRALIDNGNLITGAKGFPPRISIAATVPHASQNGPVNGQFRLTRSGGVETTLTAMLQITGSAVNGADFQYVPSQVSFAAGQRTLNIDINPYLTSSVFTQVVQVAVLAGVGYELGSPALAQVTIEPLLPQVSIQTLSPVASKLEQTAGIFLVTRSGLINNSVLVRLTVGGTAPASHYNSISPFLNLSSQQTTALISVTPKPTAVLANGLESVQISIAPDASYRVADRSTDRILLVDQVLTFGLWQQRYFPASNEDPLTFAGRDTGETGVRNLLRYAYGLDAWNPQVTPRGPLFTLAADRFSVSYKRPPAIADVDYLVEVSDDLVNWHSAAADLEQYYPAASSNDLESVFFRSTTPVSGAAKQFLRVRVELQP